MKFLKRKPKEKSITDISERAVQDEMQANFSYESLNRAEENYQLFQAKVKEIKSIWIGCPKCQVARDKEVNHIKNCLRRSHSEIHWMKRDQERKLNTLEGDQVMDAVPDYHGSIEEITIEIRHLEKTIEKIEKYKGNRYYWKVCKEHKKQLAELIAVLDKKEILGYGIIQNN